MTHYERHVMSKFHLAAKPALVNLLQLLIGALVHLHGNSPHAICQGADVPAPVIWPGLKLALIVCLLLRNAVGRAWVAELYAVLAALHILMSMAAPEAQIAWDWPNRLTLWSLLYPHGRSTSDEAPAKITRRRRSQRARRRRSAANKSRALVIGTQGGKGVEPDRTQQEGELQ